jgi:hypothetical protein
MVAKEGAAMPRERLWAILVVAVLCLPAILIVAGSFGALENLFGPGPPPTTHGPLNFRATGHDEKWVKPSEQPLHIKLLMSVVGVACYAVVVLMSIWPRLRQWRQAQAEAERRRETDRQAEALGGEVIAPRAAAPARQEPKTQGRGPSPPGALSPCPSPGASVAPSKPENRRQFPWEHEDRGRFPWEPKNFGQFPWQSWVGLAAVVALIWFSNAKQPALGMVCSGLWLVLFCLTFGLYLREKYQTQRQAQEAERKAREREAWLRTPQGTAWQEQEREKASKQKEDEERRRKEAEEAAARAKWALYHESKTMGDVARMSGKEFEEFLARLFAKMGYTDIALTPTNDQGGDLLCLSPSGTRIVIQAKRWGGSVGNSAVQELLGAMLNYGRAEGMVVTNSTFTEPARALAKKDPRIALRDGRWLAEQIKQFLRRDIPEFTWEEYNKAVKDWWPPGAGGMRSRNSRRYRRRPWY